MSRRLARLRGASSRFAAVAMIGVALLLSQAAAAQSTDAVRRAQGQSLYDEALKDMDASDYAAACPKLEQVVRLVPEAIGSRITLAECYEAQGKLASAWVSYREAQALASADGQKERESKTQTRAEALEKKLARLSIAVPAAVQGLRDLKIERDGKTVEPALWNTMVPLDKGEHTLSASAAGKTTWVKNIVVSRDGEQLTVEVGPLADEPVVAPQGSANPPPALTSPAPPFRTAPPSWYAPGTMPGAGVVQQPNVVTDPLLKRLAGVGVGVLGLGGIVGGPFLLMSGLDTQNRLGDQCASGVCSSPAAQTTFDAAKGEVTGGVILIVGGAAFALAGVVLIVTAGGSSSPRQDPAPAQPPASPQKKLSMRLSAGLGGVAVQGEW